MEWHEGGKASFRKTKSKTSTKCESNVQLFIVTQMRTSFRFTSGGLLPILKEGSTQVERDKVGDYHRHLRLAQRLSGHTFSKFISYTHTHTSIATSPPHKVLLGDLFPLVVQSAEIWMSDKKHKQDMPLNVAVLFSCLFCLLVLLAFWSPLCTSSTFTVEKQITSAFNKIQKPIQHQYR